MAVATLTAIVLTACSSDGDGGGGGTSDASFIYSSIVPENTALSTSFKAWVDEVTGKAPGDVSFEGFYGGALLAAGDELKGLQDGRADLAYLADPYYPNQLPLWSVAGVPFVTSNVEAQVRALDELYDTNEDFRGGFERNGVHVLFFLPVASTTLVTKQPVQAVADLNGLRVRSVGLMGEALSAAGAQVVSMAATETYESLQRGTIDANSATTFDVLAGQKLYEVAKNVTQTGLGNYASAAVVMSKSKWDSLDDETQKVMTDAATVAMDTSFEKLREAEDAACKAITGAGGTVSVLPEAEQAKWKAQVGDSIVDKWRQAAAAQNVPAETVDAFYDQYVAALDKHSASDYEDGMARCANGG